MNWTERYLAAALRSIPEPKRADVERELRSSIADAVEERVASGEDRLAAERAVLEGLGDPSQLAAAYSGKPNYLIGPQLYPLYRHFLPRLIAIVVPIAGVGLAAVNLLGGGSYADAIAAGISGAITAAINIAFWGTLTFIFIERADEARDAREEITARTGKWTLEKLPQPPKARILASDTVGEVITVILTAVGLLFMQGVSLPDAAGARIPLLDSAVTGTWLPILFGSLIALGGLHVLVYVAGRWTVALATIHAAVEIMFAAPIVWLALRGTLINPAFAREAGYPALSDGNGPAMLSIAVVSVLVTGWEIIDAFRKARAARGSTALAAATLGAV